MSEENTPAPSGTSGTSGTSGMDDAPQQTVWLHDDEAMRQMGDHPPELHWSQQVTQPLGARWPEPRRWRLAGRRAVAMADRESRARWRGAGWGVLVTLAALSLIAVLALANGWLPGGSSAASDSAPWPIPVQSTPHTPPPTVPATSVPTSTALPTATERPTSTALPTATPMPTATSAPTATPSPTGQPTETPSP